MKYLLPFLLMALMCISTQELSAQNSVSGAIRCGNQQAMANVAVTISGDGVNQTTYTDANGQYEFTNLANGIYNVTPSKDDNDVANGVTTLDVVVALQNIFSPDPFNPFAFLAADLNFSNSVTTMDLLLIRYILLGIETECPNGACWRFASADFNIAPASGSVDMISLQLSYDLDDVHFVGVKMGDVNFSACP